MEKKYHDEEFGVILIYRSEKARSYILKVKDGKVSATLPWRGSEKILLEFLDKNRPRLREQLKESPKLVYNESTAVQTLTFSVHIFRTDRDNFYPTLKDGVLHIACPKQTDFREEAIQCVLRLIVQRTLRAEAKRFLPDRLRRLAQQHGFVVNGIRIQASRSRWGSCSGYKMINLSLYLMQLPLHLIDYVLLHELCHTQEMNHGKRFWELLDGVTGNRAKALRKELKEQTMLP